MAKILDYAKVIIYGKKLNYNAKNINFSIYIFIKLNNKQKFPHHQLFSIYLSFGYMELLTRSCATTATTATYGMRSGCDHYMIAHNNKINNCILAMKCKSNQYFCTHTRTV